MDFHAVVWKKEDIHAAVEKKNKCSYCSRKREWMIMQQETERAMIRKGDGYVERTGTH